MPSPLRRREAPFTARRTTTTALAAISFLVLAFLAISQFGSPGGNRRANIRFATPRSQRGAGPGGEAATRAAAAPAGDKYLIGVGKADITGPVVEINFAGYADISQTGTGLRQRLYSRAFVVADAANPADRFVYLVLDTQSGDTAVRYGILAGLAGLGGDYAVYDASNVAVTGTHSHSGPGAWFNYLLPQVTSFGFDKQSYQALVAGAVQSVQRAHENLTEGYLDVGTVNVTDANLSRSLYAYLANPAEERAQYSDSVDKEMTLLRFKRASDLKDVGVLTWFPVHGTSMLENNTHVSADNKGVAAYLFEQSVKGSANVADGFVAGFSQANVGDTTPNVLGAWCDDGSGQMCSFEKSTCNGISETCHGRGPEFQMLDLGVSSCYVIGSRQFAGAKSAYVSCLCHLAPTVTNMRLADPPGRRTTSTRRLPR